MFEKIENIEGALVYHGDMHNRIYFTDADNIDLNVFVPKIKALAKQRNYEKILGRAQESAKGLLQSNGFKVEAKIPGLYNGKTDGYFLADFVSEKRHVNDEKSLKTIESVKTIALAANKPQTDAHFSIPANTTIRRLDSDDFPLLEELHKKAYKYHPNEIKDEAYFSRLQQLNHSFYGLFENNELLVSTILDVHENESNMEIVDFVTHPDYRGQNLSYFLVQDIKEQMKATGCKTVYAMVRATSYGLNITFSKHGFIFAGTLTNNCMVRNTMESMNVWYFKNE